jgi:hypothetical protein
VLQCAAAPASFRGQPIIPLEATVQGYDRTPLGRQGDAQLGPKLDAPVEVKKPGFKSETWGTTS